MVSNTVTQATDSHPGLEAVFATGTFYGVPSAQARQTQGALAVRAFAVNMLTVAKAVAACPEKADHLGFEFIVAHIFVPAGVEVA